MVRRGLDPSKFSDEQKKAYEHALRESLIQQHRARQQQAANGVHTTAVSDVSSVAPGPPPPADNRAPAGPAQPIAAHPILAQLSNVTQPIVRPSVRPHVNPSFRPSVLPSFLPPTLPSALLSAFAGGGEPVAALAVTGHGLASTAGSVSATVACKRAL
jgi:hypothetical protein